MVILTVTLFSEKMLISKFHVQLDQEIFDGIYLPYSLKYSLFVLLKKTMKGPKLSKWRYSRTTVYAPLRKNMGKLVCDCF